MPTNRTRWRLGQTSRSAFALGVLWLVIGGGTVSQQHDSRGEGVVHAALGALMLCLGIAYVASAFSQRRHDGKHGQQDEHRPDGDDSARS